MASSHHVNGAGTARHERVASKENMPMRGDTAAGLKSSLTERDYNVPSEIRTERTHTTTREKVQVRTKKPVRETVSTGSRVDYERSRSKTAATSPGPKGKAKEPAECWSSALFNVIKINC